MNSRRQFLIFQFAPIFSGRPILNVFFQDTSKIADEDGLKAVYVWILFRDSNNVLNSFSMKVQNIPKIAPRVLKTIEKLGGGSVVIDRLIKPEFQKFVDLGGFSGVKLCLEA